MIHAVDGRGASWRLIYATRSAANAAFSDELSAFGGRVELHWDDVRGGPPDVARIIASARPDAAVYCCGPEPLLQAVAERVPESRLHVERFRPPEPAVTAEAEAPIQVTCALSGHVVTVTPGISILEALVAAGVRVDSSCEEGICGTCETRVLAGIPDHRDFLLSAAEQRDRMLICVSRARTPELTLEV
jgi:ferredoxin